MKTMYFIISLTACSLVTAIPQGLNPQTIFPSPQSDDRIVNRPAPPRRQPASPVTGILIQDDFRPGVSNQRRPQEGIKPQAVDGFQASSQRPFPADGRPITTSTTPRPGNLTQYPDSHLPPLLEGPSDSVIHDSVPSERERNCGIFPNPGECQAAFPRYYYNKTTSQCDCYLFGGCDEDVGSYRTLEECHKRCLPEIKHEGPNCKFIYIDNFSPFVPSTTLPPTNTNSKPSTSADAPCHPADLPVSRNPAAGEPQSDRRPGRPIVNNRPSAFNPFFASGIPSLPETETPVSDNKIPSRQPGHFLIPVRPSPIVPLPGGIGIDVPQGGLFVAMSSSQTRFPGESEEYERDVFG